MRLSHLLLLGALTSQTFTCVQSQSTEEYNFDTSAPKLSCQDPSVNAIGTPSTPVLLNVDTTLKSVTLLLVPVIVASASATNATNVTATATSGYKGSMCILSQWSESLALKAEGRGFYIPLGRSVRNHDDDNTDGYGYSNDGAADWMVAPGKAGRSLTYKCGKALNSSPHFNTGEYLCQVTLPKTSTTDIDGTFQEFNAPYYLTYYERSLSLRNEISRFLQKVTFGPKATELDALEVAYHAIRQATTTTSTSNGTSSSPSHTQIMRQLQTEYISSQIDPTNFSSGTFTSLRAYWRKRLNPRTTETYRIGESGPHPCETYSRWRKFAFTYNDVMNSQYLRWGNIALGGSYQSQDPHLITVEEVVYETMSPTGMPTVSGVPSTSPSVSWEPSVSGRPSGMPTGRPSLGSTSLGSYAPSISSAPTGSNILGYGDMEGNSDAVLAAWPSRCERKIITTPGNSTNVDVYRGKSSLFLQGGSGRCFLIRQVGGGCLKGRLSEGINYGDTIKISLMVKMLKDNQIFEIYSAHYHVDKDRRWGAAGDDSHIISMTEIEKAGVWTKVEVVHTAGHDWKFDGTILAPKRCNHYQIRFRAAKGASSFILDDVQIQKMNNLTATETQSGFLQNPQFTMNHKNWKFASNSGFVTEEDGQNVYVLRKGRVLRQDVLESAVPNQKYQFQFKAKAVGFDTQVEIKANLRMRFRNNDVKYGPCRRKICLLYERPLRTKISGNGIWQYVVSDEFTMFGNYTGWDGKPDFIIFELVPLNLPPGGELRIAKFEMVQDATHAPSMSSAPSFAPTTLKVKNKAYIIRYANEIRTVLRHPFQLDNTGEILPMDGKSYQLCLLDEIEGDLLGEFPNRMNLIVNNRCQPIRGGNPTVHLDPRFVNMTDLHILEMPTNTDIITINEEQTLGGDLLLRSPITDDVCKTLPTPYDNDYRGADPYNPDQVPHRFAPDQPVFGLLPDGTYALYDSRLILHENTMENPKMDGGGDMVMRSTFRAANGFAAHEQVGMTGPYFVYNDKNIALCINEQPNFLNHDYCKLSYEPNACVKEYSEYGDMMLDVQLTITFDDISLASMFDATNVTADNTTLPEPRYIYAVSGLRYDASNTDGLSLDLPCGDGNPRSRWIPRNELASESCTNTLQPNSVNVLKFALETSNDENAYLRDIILWNSNAEDGCDPIDELAYGMMIYLESEGLCWENVHPDHLSVYDFTNYINTHPDPDSIIAFKDTGIFDYANRSMSEFETIKDNLELVKHVARFGDKMIVDQFADKLALNTDPTVLMAIAETMGTIMVDNKVNQNRGGGVLVCGSPNEVGPDPELDDYFDAKHNDLDCIGCQNSYENYNSQKHTVWAINMLEAEDQLCQRMAWALYEHLNVGTLEDPDNSETNLYSYDIMIRNCFGDYFSVLKEMVFNPKMSEQFNYVDSTSTRFSWDVWWTEESGVGQLVYPDENFAREVMQLYTIGLHELEVDGTEKKDKFGEIIQTYTNDDILSNARLFTGFQYRTRRGNTEELYRSSKSRFEPLRIDQDRHDFFPKTGVDGSWIGDRYPLCIDLPKYHFLSIGATYRFRGGSSLPLSHYMPDTWDANENIKRFVLSPESSLYQKLCNPDADGNCNFVNTVTIDENLPCQGKECRVDTVVIVQVSPGNFYEYIRQPCTQLSFYEGGKKVVTGYSEHVRNVGRQYTHSMCAHPKSHVAARSCCGIDSVAGRAMFNFNFEYHGEVVTYENNEAVCLANGGHVCDFTSYRADNPPAFIRLKYNAIYSSENMYYWTDSPCRQQVKVRSDAMVTIVHNPQANPDVPNNQTLFVDLENSINYIGLPWQRDPLSDEVVYPHVNNTCGSGACTLTSDDHCLCDATITEGFVFESLPSRVEVLSALHVGAVDPASYGVGTYSLLESSVDVEAYSDSGVIGSTSTIFKVKDEIGEVVFLKNFKSDVTLGGSYMIRNPVGFIDYARVERRDAEYEIDAFLNHLIRYPSAAPFICKKLIQYFGISNPTPAYVERVVNAFISGSFTSQDTTFGNGKYGSLEAVAAAITLDVESMSPVIDNDPVSGNIREPLLKVIQVMRGLDFERRQHVKLRYGLFDSLDTKIGQQVFEPKDQFSFFSSDYSPPGVFATNELVSPEAQLLSIGHVVGITNGFFSLLNYGLAFGDAGFGPYFLNLPAVGDTSSSVGYITYEANGADISSKIDDLSTLLTAGRLSHENKKVLTDAHAFFSTVHDEESADRAVLHLLLSSPEFHSSNTIVKSGNARKVTPQPIPQNVPYKAVVYINLFGGIDSFNILAPYNDKQCPLYDEYLKARGGIDGIGLKAGEMLPIDGSSQGIKGCNNFGVNSLLSAYKDIYDEGKGIFFANMGHLHKPVNKKTWLTETRTDLFSHHTMKAESHRVDAFKEADGPGVLGRMQDILQEYGLTVASTAVDIHSSMIDGDPSTGRLADSLASSGSTRFFERRFLSQENQDMREFLLELHSETADNSGLYADKWSQSFLDIWNKTDTLIAQLRSTPLATKFSTRVDAGNINQQLKLVANMIAARTKRGVNRDVFYVNMGGYDGHSDLALVMAARLPSLNAAIRNFWNEIKAQGVQNSVVVIQGSEFGRTITPNSNKGSDHAWGGNYFAFGGDIKGGRIVGEYPRGFGIDDPTNIGRGRLIPTSSWDSLWYGVSQWMGIMEQTALDRVLPNSRNFGCNLFTDADLFTSGFNAVKGCGGPQQSSSFDVELSEPRYMNGNEQKKMCKLAVKIATKRLKTDESQVRCFVDNQVISHSINNPSAYTVSGVAVLNFDASIPLKKLNNGFVNQVAKAVAATAAEFIVVEALPAATETPSVSPSDAPSSTPTISSSPTISASPTTSPRPTNFPTVTAMPSSSTDQPTVDNSTYAPTWEDRDLFYKLEGEYCEGLVSVEECNLEPRCDWDIYFNEKCYAAGTLPNPDTCVVPNKLCPPPPRHCCSGLCNGSYETFGKCANFGHSKKVTDDETSTH